MVEIHWDYVSSTSMTAKINWQFISGTPFVPTGVAQHVLHYKSNMAVDFKLNTHRIFYELNGYQRENNLVPNNQPSKKENGYR